MFFFPAQAYAQTDSGNSDKKTYALSGTVVNSITGEPVQRALVQIYLGGEKSMLTGADGRFEFTGLPEGQTSVNVQKPGYFTDDQMRLKNGWSPPSLITIGPEGSGSAVVKLVPESVIAGKVTANGEPVEGVPVKVFATQMQEGHREWVQPGGAITNEDGEFRLPNLQAGEYYLEVGPKWVAGATAIFKGHESGYGRVFYPSAPGIDGATPLVVNPGQRSEVEISLKLEPWYKVSGALRSPDPNSNININFVDSTGEAIGDGARIHPETGEFETRLPAGNYTLQAMAYGAKGVAGVAHLPVTVNGDLPGIQVALGPAMTVPVKVKKEETKNHSDSEQAPALGSTFYSGGGGLRHVRRMDTIAPLSMWFRSTASVAPMMVPMVGFDETGAPESFAVRNLQPGTYWAQVMRNPPWYVESAQCGNVDLLRESLTVGAGPPCAEIDVVLRDDGAKLSITSSWDGDPPAATVLVIPDKAPEQTFTNVMAKGASTDASDLAPGDYSVLVVDNAAGLEYKNPDVLSGLMSKAAHVTLSANQSTSVKVDLTRVGK